MKWLFINSGSNTGRYNMDYDLQLAKNYKDDEIIFRLYRWGPYCISLGANQPPDSINSELARQDNIEIVIRPTGGRAVLHAEELTYSVVYPLDLFSSAKDIYCQLNLALLKGLKIYDNRLSSFELENHQPNFAEIYKQENNAVCFAVSAKSEIKFSGKKIVGSAQRKFENVVLQHGSILCGPFHKRITHYLNLSDEKKIEIEKEIEINTIELCKILNEKIDYSRLTLSLCKGFEEHYKMVFSNSLSLHNDLILINN
jgi:lipoate-protein ligase A